ncbi:ABC transporter permease [Sandaracinobacteroides hominis]|uniref:ABC transporter permease n=1 Tax=Sandaracinobacteroides hominis TaxID=2780086 RepID=UPI0018F3B29D|nr:ABC transporter permease [Sandaracinobacteroides hominis]
MKEPKALLDYARSWPLRLWMGAVGLFLYLPLAVLIVMSFNDSRRTTKWQGFTFDWYGKVFQDTELMGALGNSLTIAAFSTVISLILGTLAAIALWRFRFPGRTLVDGSFSLPIVVPEICMGVALLIFFARILPWPGGMVWPLSLGAIIISHVAFSFPFVAVVVRARLESFDRSMEEAARDLGASEWQALRDVVVPHLQPALLAGALLAFTLSLDDFVITFFTAGPDTVTFPVKVYSMVRFSVSPKVNAISTLLLVFTVLLTFIALRLQAKAEAEKS